MRSQYARAEQKPSQVRIIDGLERHEIQQYEQSPVWQRLEILARDEKLSPLQIHRKLSGLGLSFPYIVNKVAEIRKQLATFEQQSEIDDELEFQAREEHFDKIPDRYTRFGQEA